MGWHASLALDYSRREQRTVAHFLHDGPLRVLQSLYPEGDGVCHNVLVHPPGGLVGGDTLEMRISAAGDAHGLVTTPGATRFYRSEGEPALQHAHITLHDQSRLEWLPLETICYTGCNAENRLTISLAPEAELMGWDITALGLPSAAQTFDNGKLQQHLEINGIWLERGLIHAQDQRLMNGPLGLAGHRCSATLFFASGNPIQRARSQQALDLARELIAGSPLSNTAGATAPNTQVVVVRVLAPLVEPAMQLLRAVRSAWRSHFWDLEGTSPRIWST
jgi:urease accessory protein